MKACAADGAVITSKPSSSFPTTTDKYAIVDVGGVQHLVEEGRWYTCNRLKASPGDVVSFGRVLAVKDEDVFHVGRPYVEDVTVEAEIIEEFKGPKVTIYKMQPKKHTRKQVGHRQPLTKCVLQREQLPPPMLPGLSSHPITVLQCLLRRVHKRIARLQTIFVSRAWGNTPGCVTFLAHSQQMADELISSIYGSLCIFNLHESAVEDCAPSPQLHVITALHTSCRTSPQASI